MNFGGSLPVRLVDLGWFLVSAWFCSFCLLAFAFVSSLFVIGRVVF